LKEIVIQLAGHADAGPVDSSSETDARFDGEEGDGGAEGGSDASAADGHASEGGDGGTADVGTGD